MLNISYPPQDQYSPPCILPIMVYLSPADLVRAREVCQIWRNFIDREFGPDLSAIRISAEGLPTNGILGEYSCYHLSLFDNQEVISVGRNISDRGFAHLMERMPQGIRAINIVDSDNLTARSFHELALRLGKVLIELNIWNCEKLTGGDLSISVKICTELTSLSLRHCSHLTGTQFRPLMQSLPKNVKTFELIDCPKLKPRDFSSFNQASQLTRLTIQRCAGLTDQAFAATIRCLPSLTELDISQNPSLTDQATVLLAKSGVSLKTLKLDGPQITRESLGHLAAIPEPHWPERISFGGSTRMLTLMPTEDSGGMLNEWLIGLAGYGNSENVFSQSLPYFYPYGQNITIDPWIKTIFIPDHSMLYAENLQVLASKLPSSLHNIYMVWPHHLDNDKLSEFLGSLPATIEGLCIICKDPIERISVGRLMTVANHLPQKLKKLSLINFIFSTEDEVMLLLKNIPKTLLVFEIVNLCHSSRDCSFWYGLDRHLPEGLSQLVISAKSFRFSPSVVRNLPRGLKRFSLYDHDLDNHDLDSLSKNLPTGLEELLFNCSSKDGSDQSWVSLIKALPNQTKKIKLPRELSGAIISTLSNHLPAGIQSLDFSHSNINDGDVELLAPKLPRNLLELKFFNCRNLTSSGFRKLALHLPSKLKDLNLSGNKSNFDDTALAAIASALPPNLKTLILDGNSLLSYSGFRSLADHFPPGLVLLELSGCQGLDERSLTYLSSRLPSGLKLLGLSHIDASDRGLAEICSQLPLGLFGLQMNNCKNMSQLAISALAERVSSELMILNLSGNTLISDQAFVVLGNSLQHSLIDLNLEGCTGIGDKGLIALLKHALKNVKELKLNECRSITEIGFKALAEQMPTNLTALDLSHTRLSPKSLYEIIGSVISSESLIDLNLGFCNLSDNSIEYRFLSENLPRNLKSLSLKYVDIKSNHRFYNALPAGLNKLNLSHTGITDADISKFIKYCPKMLEELDLSWCKISYTSMIELIDALPALRHLDLHGCADLSESEKEVIRNKMEERKCWVRL